MARMFGTDGVRGVAGSELTIELATKLGQAGAYVLTKEQEHQATIIVGCDTRISGGMLASALMAGICSVGANAIFVGVMPTPAIAYLTRKHKVDAPARGACTAPPRPGDAAHRAPRPCCYKAPQGADDLRRAKRHTGSPPPGRAAERAVPRRRRRAPWPRL